MAQIAISTGLTLDQFRTLMVEVRTQAIEQALNDGVLTQAQAEWMSQRGAGQMAGGQMGNGSGMRGAGQGQFANPNCPYYQPDQSVITDNDLLSRGIIERCPYLILVDTLSNHF